MHFIFSIVSNMEYSWDVVWSTNVTPEDKKRISAFLGGVAKGANQVVFYLKRDLEKVVVEELLKNTKLVETFKPTPTAEDICMDDLRRQTELYHKTKAEPPKIVTVQKPCPIPEPPTVHWWMWLLLGSLVTNILRAFL